MKTAREFITENVNLSEVDRMMISFDEVERLMKMYADEIRWRALFAAGAKVSYTTERDRFRNITSVTINTQSILEAYGPENIK